MKRLITLAMAVMAIGTVSAQQDNGGISDAMMSEIRQYCSVLLRL